MTCVTRHTGWRCLVPAGERTVAAMCLPSALVCARLCLLLLRLQVLRYSVGQQYKPHMDVLNAEEAGPRMCTVLLYLNGEGAGSNEADRQPATHSNQAAPRQLAARAALPSRCMWHSQHGCAAAAADVEEGGETAFPDSNHW